MKVVRSWLNEFIDLGDRSNDEITKTLENLGHEVERVTNTDQSETIFELAITANRGDVLSHLGVARELAAKWGQKVTLPGFHMTSVNGQVSPDKVWTQIKTDFPGMPKTAGVSGPACGLYTLRYLRNLKNTELPQSITSRLKLVDHQLYHPAVDITNYVMEELGVPLHVFDAAKIVGAIKVRLANEAESIELLDGKTYTLTPRMLVIADEKGPIALAGIMGGARTAVSDQTRDVVLEAAYFQPQSIRRTRTALGLNTSASYRFERGADPDRALQASDRAASLMNEHLGAKIGERSDAGAFCDLRARDQITIIFDAARLTAWLGSSVSVDTSDQILERLGFIKQGSAFAVPSWRHDAKITEDLIEEVARVLGYDNLSRTLLAPAQPVSNPENDRWFQIEALKDQLSRLGFSEQIGSSFLSDHERALLKILPSDIIKLANPVSEEAAYLRSTQLLSVLKVIAKNPIFSDLKVFEIGTVWSRPATGEIADPRSRGSEKVTEHTVLTLAWIGIKSIQLPSILEHEFGSPADSEILNKLKIHRSVMVAELPIDPILELLSAPLPVMLPPKRVIFRQPARFQPVMRDVAILVDQTFSPSDIMSELQKIDHVVDVELFDQFTGGKLPQDKQSLAYHLLLEHPDHMLEAQEIERVLEQVTHIVTKKFKAILR